MSLTEAIKDVIAGRGVAIIGTHRFVNALDDFHAFRDEPVGSKIVMRGLMDAGLAISFWNIQRVKLLPGRTSSEKPLMIMQPRRATKRN